MINNHLTREREAIQIFEENQIIIADDHFVYAAGGHGDAYVQKDKTLVTPDTFLKVTKLMAEDLNDVVNPKSIDYLVGFAPCSSLYASRIAEHLNADYDANVKMVFMEKISSIKADSEGKPYIHEALKFKRGFGELLIGKRAWLVEDIVTTGKSLVEGKEQIELIEDVELLGASAAYSRSPETVTRNSLGLNIWQPLIEKSLTVYPADECPMDSDLTSHPINTQLGHGKKWLEERNLL